MGVFAVFTVFVVPGLIILDLIILLAHYILRLQRGGR
ncbi:hypothetical protein J3E07_001666 [Methanococcus voltae]|uniref:Uncharacterized protein n=1 Tax=Methanococcus voltae TaxID=2188 RepID=A0A8J7RIT3_METVO|nr:hypothetical protein [Methanococcus voltae]